MSSSTERLRKVRIEMFETQKNCFYCEKTIHLTHNKDNSATIEHLVKLSDGGTNERSNLTLACGKCNSTRDNFPVDIWKILCKEKFICHGLYACYNGKRKHRPSTWLDYVTKDNIESFNYGTIRMIMGGKFSSDWNRLYSRINKKYKGK